MCDFNEYQDQDGTFEEHGICMLPPEGWYCSRDKGHEGPCAASPIEEPSHISTEDVRHCIAGTCTCDERAKLARPITVDYSWRDSIPWRFITNLFTFDVPNWGPGVYIPAEPKPEVETEEWIEWTEPFFESEPVIMRVRPTTAVNFMNKMAAEKPHPFSYKTYWDALDDFLAVHWAAIVRYPKEIEPMSEEEAHDLGACYLDCEFCQTRNADEGD